GRREGGCRARGALRAGAGGGGEAGERRRAVRRRRAVGQGGRQRVAGGGGVRIASLLAGEPLVERWQSRLVGASARTACARSGLGWRTPDAATVISSMVATISRGGATMTGMATTPWPDPA